MKAFRAAGICLGLAIVSRAAFAQTTSPVDQTISPKTLLPRILSDQKKIWTFPVTAVRGKGWKPALGVIGATAALIALDPLDTPYFQQTSFQQSGAVHTFNNVLSGTNTGLAIAALPVSFYLVGLARKDSYASQTALLAGEAVASAEILSIVMKDVDLRMRPSEVGPDGDFTDTWFRTKNRSLGGFGSFPSGHTASAFAVATIFSERYKNHRWVPWVAYSLASVVGFSRLTTQAHFPSDLFMGAALGYSISHFVVLRHPSHR